VDREYNTSFRPHHTVIWLDTQNAGLHHSETAHRPFPLLADTLLERTSSDRHYRTEITMTGGEILVACLEAQGISTIVGMPGNQNIWIYDALIGSSIQHYLIRNEQGATLIANGYARASGEVGVALTVPGPGSTNASTGIVDAHTDCVPTLLVTGGTEIAYDGRDRSKCFHGMDQRAFFAPITRAFERPQSVEDIPSCVERVFTALRSSRPGPAVLELPVDVAASTGTVEIPNRITPGLDSPCPKDLTEVANAIRTYNRPVILIGKSVADNCVSEDILALSNAIDAPILFTRLGKGAISDLDPAVVGHCHAKAGRSVLSEGDGLIAIGCRFTQIDTRSWTLPMPDKRVQLDVDPNELGREYDIQAGASGDLAVAVKALTEQLADTAHPDWKAAASAIKQTIRSAQPPLELFSAIRKHTDKNAIFSVDVTSLGYRTFDELPIYGPHTFLYPCHSVTLGFGMPAAIGAKLAKPERQVVAFCGDGGYQMTSFELATAVEHDLDITVVVVNDGSLSAIRGSQAKTFEGRVLGTDMRVPQIADAANAFGARGVRVSPDKFETVFADVVGLDGPTVVEVMMTDQRDAIIQRVPWLYPD
jgi:acetolactate synthase-1/2/3 large subunit